MKPVELFLLVCRQSQQVEKYVFELIDELKRKMKMTEMASLEVALPDAHTHKVRKSKLRQNEMAIHKLISPNLLSSPLLTEIFPLSPSSLWSEDSLPVLSSLSLLHAGWPALSIHQ